MLEATLALATIIRRTEIRSLRNEFPVAFPFTLVAAEPVLAQVNAHAEPDEKIRLTSSWGCHE